MIHYYFRVEQDRFEALAHVPFEMAREHAQEDMGAHPRHEPVVDRVFTSEAIEPKASAGVARYSPFWMKGQQKVRPRRAPAVGEHSEEVLREAGDYDADGCCAPTA